MGGWMDALMDGWIGGWMYGWIDGWMDWWMDGWMREWRDQFTYSILAAFLTCGRSTSSVSTSGNLASNVCIK